jgi:flagellar biosynthesis protein FlhG
MSEAIRKQHAIVDLFPNSTSAAAFHALAERLATMTTRRYPKGSVQFFWKQLLQTDLS